MNISMIAAKLPDYAADIKKVMLDAFVFVDSKLEERQLYGIALTAAYQLRNEQLLNCVRKEAKFYLEEQDAHACKLAVVHSALMAQYHETSHEKYGEVVQMLGSIDHRVDDVDFSLYCFVASSLRRCDDARSYYICDLEKYGIGINEIKVISQIVAGLCAACEAIDIESVRSYEFVVRQSSL